MTDQQVFAMKENLNRLLTEKIGKFLLPKDIGFVKELPKNRSGKILRRLIRQKLVNNDIACDDLLLVENPESLDGIHSKID
jgi:acetyl-CoA synthetase